MRSSMSLGKLCLALTVISNLASDLARFQSASSSADGGPGHFVSAGRIRKKYFGKIFYDFVQPVPVYLIEPSKYLNVHMIHEVNPHELLVKIRKEESRRNRKKALKGHKPFALVLNNVEQYYPLSPPPAAEVHPEPIEVPLGHPEPMEPPGHPEPMEPEPIEHPQPPMAPHGIPVVHGEVVKVEKNSHTILTQMQDHINHESPVHYNNDNQEVPIIIRPEVHPHHSSHGNDINSVAKISSVQTDEGITHEIDIPTDHGHSGPLVIDLSSSASTFSTEASTTINKPTTPTPMVTYSHSTDVDDGTGNSYNLAGGGDDANDHEAKASSASLSFTKQPPSALKLTSPGPVKVYKSTQAMIVTTTTTTTTPMSTVTMEPIGASASPPDEQSDDSKRVTSTINLQNTNGWTPVVQIKKEDAANLKAFTEKLIASALAAHGSNFT